MMLVILLISFVISNTIAKHIVESKVTDSAGKILLQVQDKTESFYADMERISFSMQYSPTVQTYLDLDDYLSRILMHHEVISVFSNTITLKENIRGIQLYNRAGTMVASLGLGTGESVKLPDPKIEYSGLLKDPDTEEIIPTSIRSV
jgi:two-component system sensor histidine kinase YesM